MVLLVVLNKRISPKTVQGAESLVDKSSGTNDSGQRCRREEGKKENCLFIQTYTALRRHHFNITAGDVLVMLHIQKTGGSSFGHHMAHNLDVPEHPCKCKNDKQVAESCSCRNQFQEEWLHAR